MVKNKTNAWQWEITYEDDENGQLGSLPLINVPNGHKMPSFLMIWEARNTGEFEPGLSGEDVPVVEWELRQYAQMDVLKQKLSADDYDKVRLALGLQPLAEATAKGKEITQSIRENVANKELERLNKKF